VSRSIAPFGKQDEEKRVNPLTNCVTTINFNLDRLFACYFLVSRVVNWWQKEKHEILTALKISERRHCRERTERSLLSSHM